MELKTLKDFTHFLGKNQNKYIIIKFTAKWCGPCKMIQPLFDKLHEEHKSTVNIATVDIDNENMSELIEEWKISSLPTFVLLEKNTQNVLDIFSGASNEKLVRLFNKTIPRS
jgi:thiol-disulfide isomerase/thioredoxin